MTMKCAIYARVSLPAQDISAQTLPLYRLAAERGLEVVAEYHDMGFSGTKARRPGLDSLMADARRRRFEIVLVAGFDRIARSTRHFLLVVGELSELGVGFVSVREAVDTTGPAGQPFLALARSIGELEGALVRERIRQGMARRRLEGFRLGRAPLDVDRDAIVRERLNGMSLTKVAKKYNVSRGSVVRFSRQAKMAEATPVGEFRPAPVPEIQHEQGITSGVWLPGAGSAACGINTRIGCCALSEGTPSSSAKWA
jgi:DNA invertase Pin-like site-specific DNA recombinase